MVCNQIRIGNFRPTCLVHLDSVNSLRRVLFVFPYYTSTTVQCCQASGFAPSIFSSKTRGKNANQPLLLTARFGFSPLVSVNAKAHHYKALTTYIRFYLKILFIFKNSSSQNYFKGFKTFSVYQLFETLVEVLFRIQIFFQSLKVSRSRNKIVMPKLLPKNK